VLLTRRRAALEVRVARRLVSDVSESEGRDLGNTGARPLRPVLFCLGSCSWWRRMAVRKTSIFPNERLVDKAECPRGRQKFCRAARRRGRIRAYLVRRFAWNTTTSWSGGASWKFWWRRWSPGFPLPPPPRPRARRQGLPVGYAPRAHAHSGAPPRRELRRVDARPVAGRAGSHQRSDNGPTRPRTRLRLLTRVQETVDPAHG